MQIEYTEYYICDIFVYISVAAIREKFLETRFIFIFRESTALDDLNVLPIVMCSYCFVAVFYTQVGGLFTKPAIAKRNSDSVRTLALERDQGFCWQRDQTDARKTRLGLIVPSTFGGTALSPVCSVIVYRIYYHFCEV
jgi:hypothetical protein